MQAGVRRKSNSRAGAAARSVSPGYGSRAKAVFISVFLAALVCIVFGQTLRHEFVNYDDDEYVYENSAIANGLSPGGIQWAFTHVHSGNWHPLTTISHMLDCQLFGLQPWGHHLTNLLLHAAAAIFLFFALRDLTGGDDAVAGIGDAGRYQRVRQQRGGSGAGRDQGSRLQRGGSAWASAFVAAIFAIHPLRVASVAWISERKDVLSGVFFALTLWAYARYAREGFRSYARRARPSSGGYITVIVLFALGLLCKPTLVTLPFLLLLLDYWPLRRFNTAQSFRRLVLEKIPLFILSAASCVATMLAQKKALITVGQLTFAERVGNALISYVIYLGQMIWPARLSAVYPYPEGDLNLAQVILAFLLLLIISVVFFLVRRKYPFLIIGWLWFLGMLVPMIGIIQVGPQAHADRYTYLPQIGLYILLTWGAMELFARWRVRREAAIGIALSVIIAFAAVSCLQTSHWRNSETLWRQALINTFGNYIAENGLGSALLRKGQIDEAASHFRKAVQIYPDYPEANNNLGFVLASQGNWADSIGFYQAALRTRPNYAKARNNLGISLAENGKTDEAIEQFREALRTDDNYAEAHTNLGHLLLQLGRRDEAVAHLREALRLKPDYADVKEQLRQLGVEK
jgi:tetratricopeptide (TPR) repeat protein